MGWHASRVTDRVRVTTGNTMDPDKHWLMHIHTTTLHKGDASTDQPQIQRATLMRYLMRIHAHHHHAHAHMHAGMQHTHADRYSHMHTCASHTSSSSSHPPTPTPAPHPPTHPHKCTNTDTRPRKHTVAQHLSTDWILYITPSQVLLGGGDSFTVLAGRPHSFAREVKLWMP